MRLIVKLRRSIQKKYFPTERDLVMRRWKADNRDRDLRLDYDLPSDSVVLDLGGYLGDWADDVHQRFGCAIHVFEPVASFADKISQRFEGNGSIAVHRCGLGERTRSETIGLSDDSSSVFQSGSNQEPIELIDVAEWFQRHDVRHVSLMKINIEGGEYELLERMLETNLTARVDNIQVQFHHLGEDSPSRMNAILQRLRATHRPTYQYPFVWENWCRTTTASQVRAA